MDPLPVSLMPETAAALQESDKVPLNGGPASFTIVPVEKTNQPQPLRVQGVVEDISERKLGRAADLRQFSPVGGYGLSSDGFLF